MIAVGQLLLLVLIANGAPVITRVLLGRRWGRPVDGGRLCFDGHPWLGPSKTLRGVVAALLCSTVAAVLIGLTASIGLLVGAGAMLGDLLSSFIKRRLGIPSSGMALGLDQIPEVLIPALLVRSQLDISWAEVAGIVAAFVVLELVLSRILFALNIRRHPF
jgi:CDP-2,3-bis-(O-geranylgeranyl)-sn-glycerol synthase